MSADISSVYLEIQQALICREHCLECANQALQAINSQFENVQTTNTQNNNTQTNIAQSTTTLNNNTVANNNQVTPRTTANTVQRQQVTNNSNRQNVVANNNLNLSQTPAPKSQKVESNKPLTNFDNGIVKTTKNVTVG